MKQIMQQLRSPTSLFSPLLPHTCIVTGWGEVTMQFRLGGSPRSRAIWLRVFLILSVLVAFSHRSIENSIFLPQQSVLRSS